MRADKLQYYEDSRVEVFSSITNFCNKHPELGANAKHHFSAVFNCKRFHYKGWHLVWDKDPIILEDISGFEYKINNPLLFVRSFERKISGQRLLITNLLDLLTGRRNSYGGLSVKGVLTSPILDLIDGEQESDTSDRQKGLKAENSNYRKTDLVPEKL